MNSLETDYSFLAPTWKLPSVGSRSMHPGTYGTSYPSPPPRSTPDLPTLNNTMHNSRYVPPTTNRRAYPTTTNQPMQTHPPPPSHQQQSYNQYRNDENPNDRLDFPKNGNNAYSQQQQIDNRGLNHSQPVQKRVQIIDHNHQTPSPDHFSGEENENFYSHTPDFNQTQKKSKPRRDYIEDNKSDSTYTSVQRPNNFNVHEYLYGLSAPDPGSYVAAYKNNRRRIHDEKVSRKPVMTVYKNFVQNGGFGPAFGDTNYHTFEEKHDTEMKRKSYSKIVRETNQYKIEEQKRVQNNGGQQRNRTVPVLPMPKHRRPDELRSHFLSAQESPLELSSRFSIVSPVLQHFPDSPALHQSSFDTLHPWHQSDLLSGEFCIDRSSSTSSSSPTPRYVRLLSHDFVRRRSSTFIDLPSSIISRRIESTSTRSSTPMSAAKILEEKDHLERLQKSTRHMMNSDMQSPPTAMPIINQPYRSENTVMATTSTNNTRKPILIIRSPENSSKTTSRNVRFGPEITTDDDQVTKPIESPQTTPLTPGPLRKLTPSTITDSKIKSKA